ncbi:TonB-dependent receptor domain-containing protein [Congregibacter litoralis]|uniref:Outer membrane cobalamin receptor protein n=1 Tax=Congregibacter litoralis KT71 TaxID=314285 RepID=A4ABT9_9GAMM|nr:TonB-dependent receptor [Congregibacter litoralis]EAQ96602.1 Outer membrane cobalamin receptor protein [Congregibacter litoralis KT71]
MNKKTPFLLTTLTTLTTLASSIAMAQSPTSSSVDPGAEIEEVVVTGSRIKRKDYTSISPLVTLDAEQITLSGITAIEDLVNDAPQLVPLNNRTSNNPGNGTASLNLRGLGSNRTLVTLNGRRLIPADPEGSVDINTIPSQLIKRVEIVTGGASTVYGSDAVAGVVNFILNDDFRGLEVTAQYDSYEEGDGAVADLSAVFGFGNDRGSVTGFLNYQDREEVFAGDRVFTTERLQESFNPADGGALVPAGSGTIPAGSIVFPAAPAPGSGGFPGSVTFNEDGSPRAFVRGQDQYNFQPDNYLQTPLRRDSAAVFGKFEINDQLRAFGELVYSQTSSTSQLAPPPAFVQARVNLDNPLLTPAQRSQFANGAYDPDGDGVAEFIFAKRLVDTGPRIQSRESDTLRAVLGLQGDFASSWEWEASYSMSQVRGEFVSGNAVFADRFAQGLLVDPATGACVDPSNGCVPFNPFGLPINADAVEFLKIGDLISTSDTDEDIVSLILTGDAYELPAGPIGIAAGLEWRELSSKENPDPNFLNANVLGANAQAPIEGATDVAEVFLEALVPLLAGERFADYLGIEAGYRYSDYKFSGVADNWKVGLDWAPTSSLRFRAMAQQAIRAPNIEELFAQPRAQPSVIFDSSTDFCSASADPVGNGLTDLCVAQGIPADQVGIYEATEQFPLLVLEGGGNTALDPETADTFTAGVVLQPEWAEDLSLSLDYYRIEIEDAIGGTSFEGSLGLCADSADPDSQFCNSLVRAPSGDISEYTNPQYNLANISAEGVDLTVNYRFDLGDSLALPGHSASIALQLLFNYAMENTFQATADSVETDCAGFYGGACNFGVPLFQVVPEYRSSTRLTYYSGPLSLALNWRWIGEIANHIDITCEESPEFCYPTVLGDIGSQNYFEFSGRFEFGERAEIYGGVSNIFEEEPPLMGRGATQSNTAPQLYDVFGRRFFLGLRVRL